VNIPNAEGGLTMTVNANPVQLSDAALSADFATFASTGQLGAMTITDNRHQSQPGWSVTGQVGDFTSASDSFNGGYLGWTPTIISANPNRDVIVGPAVPAGIPPGLRAGSLLASAAQGHGLDTTMLGADLDLRFPSNNRAGAYSATLTITVIE
jgi:hypothetical protein